MMNPKRFDARTLFLLAALVGAGSLFVTTLTGEAPESFAEDAKSIPEGAPAEKAPGESADKTASDKVAADKTENAEASAPAPKARGCLTAEASIEDVRDLKRELARKEQELKRREEELTAKEKAVQEELQSLETVRDEIKSAQSISTQKNEEKIAKLVETFESMSPKAAAAIVGTVDERLAVEAMTRLSSQKLGKILAAMEPTKSSVLAERLAGVARAKKESRKPASNDADADESVKGGESNGNRKQLSTDDDAVASRQPEPALGNERAAGQGR